MHDLIACSISTKPEENVVARRTSRMCVNGGLDVRPRCWVAEEALGHEAHSDPWASTPTGEAAVSISAATVALAGRPAGCETLKAGEGFERRGKLISA